MTTRNHERHILLEEIFEEDAETTQPLSEDEIAAWRGGTLDEETREALLARLACDKEAVAALVGDPEEEPANVSEAEAEASWQRFIRRLERKGSPTVALIDNKKPRRPFPWSQSLAAALMLTTALLAFRLVQLSQANQILQEPTLGEPFYVSLGGPNTRALEQPDEPFGQKRSYVIMVHRAMGDHPIWRVTLTDPEGTILFEEETSLDQAREIDLNLVRGYFARPGTHRVTVTGRGGDGPERSDSFDVEIPED